MKIMDTAFRELKHVSLNHSCACVCCVCVCYMYNVYAVHMLWGLHGKLFNKHIKFLLVNIFAIITAGLQFIQARATAMHEACQKQPGTMSTVIGLEEGKLAELCEKAQANGAGEVCIGNILFPRGYVISGALKAVQEVRTEAESAGATVKDIAVSGAFHSPLMEPALEKIRSVLDTLEITLPQMPVYSNVTGQPYTTPSEIRENLALHIIRPVQWEKVIQEMSKANDSPHFLEVGPGKQLKTMLRRINKDSYKNCQNFEI